jgi:RNA recognition motif-containing protein
MSFADPVWAWQLLDVLYEKYKDDVKTKKCFKEVVKTLSVHGFIPQKTRSNQTLYIRGLEEPVDEESLLMLFSQFGTVVSISITHKNTGSVIGFVTFGDAQTAQLAMSSHDKLQESKLRLEWAKQTTKKAQKVM